MKERKPAIGDIIASSKFAFGRYDTSDKEKKGPVTVDGKSKEYKISYSMPEEERVALAAKTGEIPEKNHTIDLGAYDEKRSIARFVVETGEMKGGGDAGMFYRNTVPNAWFVTARRLNDDGTYNPMGEVISFCTDTHSYNCSVSVDDIKIIGKMELEFTE